jgi:arylsulfatase A-like enzyme
MFSVTVPKMRKGLWIAAVMLLIAGVSYFGWRRYQTRKHPNVILIVVDALRAQELSCYGYNRNTTPHIDQFAKNGTLFEKAFCPLPATQPSFSTLLTSLHPYSHGVLRHGWALSNDAITLPELLKVKGFDTAAVAGASNLDSLFGLSQGFDFYEDSLGSKEKARNPDRRKRWQRRAGEVNDVVFHWLESRKSDKPFFLMMHYFDPHAPYEPPPPFDTKFPSDQTQSGQWRAAYDGEVAYVDTQFQRLLDKLDEMNLTDHTLIIFTADHGESLGEHGWQGHDQKVYDEDIHIPLIFSGPGIPKGKRVPALVQNIDLTPTILECEDFPVPTFFQGRSLLPVIETGKGRDFIFVQIAKRPDNFEKLTPDWQKYPETVWAIRTENEKLIWASDGKREFYDLQHDPTEQQNIYEQRKEKATEIENMGLKFLTLYKHYNYNSTTRQSPGDNNPDEALRALGYIN